MSPLPSQHGAQTGEPTLFLPHIRPTTAYRHRNFEIQIVLWATGRTVNSDSERKETSSRREWLGFATTLRQLFYTAQKIPISVYCLFIFKFAGM